MPPTHQTVSGTRAAVRCAIQPAWLRWDPLVRTSSPAIGPGPPTVPLPPCIHHPANRRSRERDSSHSKPKSRVPGQSQPPWRHLANQSSPSLARFGVESPRGMHRHCDHSCRRSPLRAANRESVVAATGRHLIDNPRRGCVVWQWHIRWDESLDSHTGSRVSP